MQTETIPIVGMTCSGCTRSVQRALAGLPGVVGVDVQLEPGEARVTIRAPGSRREAVAAIVAAGFEVPELQSPSVG